MKRLCVLLSAGLLSLTSYAQKEIKPSEAINHVGDSVIVTGGIMGGRYLSNAKGAPTLLNMGAPFPNQHLTLVIWSDSRSKFTVEPESAFNNRLVRVTGKIELYKGKPQIEVTDEKQITIIQEVLATPPVIKD